jgi:hypothetical protein
VGGAPSFLQKKKKNFIIIITTVIGAQKLLFLVEICTKRETQGLYFSKIPKKKRKIITVSIIIIIFTRTQKLVFLV